MTILTEWRESDDPDRGYCPVCGEQLTNITLEGMGFCERHGWQFAEWQPATDEENEE